MNICNIYLSTEEARWVRNAVYKWYGIDPVSSIRKQITYVTRCCDSKRFNENDNEVLAALKEIHPQTVVAKFDGSSFEMQVRMMVDTRLLISIHGAQLTNLIFMHPGSGVIEIFNPQFSEDCYERLSKLCELKYTAFRSTRIVAEIPIEIRRTWWHSALNYHTLVDIPVLVSVVKSYVNSW